MPIYEYQALRPEKGCPRCRTPFEVLQGIGEKPLATCPQCGAKLKKIISWCRAAIIERSDEDIRVEKTIKEYESSGMWSHAAELADKHSEKTKDKDLKMRALDNYEKAGYDPASLAKHAEPEND
ncbi:MAG: zinc ribbon domain-containing protein [Deltaproteobacteria bacterium]|nr:zinc ribbon domain-containing protein [Deltaproteobacteria bacterium]MBW2016784.1 zinc ribbon domain-containing protein [Deltaproteobacteria bacterium]MBW2128464.1 zinc ribbon domain-containing protein [Deltaproteobacteria bacterium]MBW2303482.1 zinc ribbon domain-containing protein [Deltaproteobacteria bacterium]